ncbi:hypothetical protein B0H13DRAFT_1958359, partial [Mycena leptocephala]
MFCSRGNRITGRRLSFGCDCRRGLDWKVRRLFVVNNGRLRTRRRGVSLGRFLLDCHIFCSNGRNRIIDQWLGLGFDRRRVLGWNLRRVLVNYWILRSGGRRNSLGHFLLGYIYSSRRNRMIDLGCDGRRVLGRDVRRVLVKNLRAGWCRFGLGRFLFDWHVFCNSRNRIIDEQFGLARDCRRVFVVEERNRRRTGRRRLSFERFLFEYHVCLHLRAKLISILRRGGHGGGVLEGRHNSIGSFCFRDGRNICAMLSLAVDNTLISFNIVLSGTGFCRRVFEARADVSLSPASTFMNSFVLAIPVVESN